ncbi:MAG: PilZ domain-containing protein, partial [Hyphomicrobiaceae bacterium]
RRTFGRREVTIHAFAHLPGRSPEPCLVRNLSGSGALVELNARIDELTIFRLVVDAKGIDTLCEVRRKSGKSIGVQFVADESTVTAAAEPAISYQSVEDDPGNHVRPPDQDGPATPTAAFAFPGTVSIVSGQEMRRTMFGSDN